MRPHTQLLAFDPAPGDPCRPVATPIYQTATFDQESALHAGPYDYSRSGNPTRHVLERQLARLDGGRRAFAFASGLAALTAATRLLRPGDELLAGDDLYGGTWRLLHRLLQPRGIHVRHVDLTDLRAAEEAIRPRTRLVLVESLSNPLLRAADVPALAGLAHRAGARLCVDASAVSPWLQRPLALGADLVVHSATKYLSGHADVTAGVVVVDDDALAEELYLVQNGEGAVLGPFECFLLLRGLQTLGIRLERQQETARRVAAFLRPRVALLRDPGQGAVLAFETGSTERSRRVVEALRLFHLSVSFGSVHSSASLPCRMSHASIPAEVRRARHLPEDLVRLSLGLEDADDLCQDLEQALAAAGAELAAS